MSRYPAFDELVAAHGARLVRTAYLLTGDRALAEDLVQTALVKTYQRWSRIGDADAGAAYARRVIATTYAKWWRRRWRGETPTETLPDRASPDVYASVDERDALRRALAALPAAQRAVVILRFVEDLTEPQVAEALGCSVGTVKSRTSRALAALRTSGILAAPAADPFPAVIREELA